MEDDVGRQACLARNVAAQVTQGVEQRITDGIERRTGRCLAPAGAFALGHDDQRNVCLTLEDRAGIAAKREAAVFGGD